MAITTQERTNILKLTVGLFNAAPGANYLSEFTSVFEANGHNLAALAGTLGTTGAFQSLYPNFQTASEFATKFLTTLGLQGNTEAVDFVTAKFNAGVPKAQIIYDAVVALDASTSAEFAAAKAILVNKAAVAENYSLTLGASSTSLETLQGALANVTADPASVTAANAANAGGNGQTFTLTTSAASVNEGGSAVFTLATTNVAAGTKYAYVLSGVGAADIDGGQLTGEVTIGADGKAYISVNIAADNLTEGAETLTLTTAGKTVSVTVNDTSTTPAPVVVVPTYALSAAAASVNEGGTAVFTLDTTNVASGSKVGYVLSGVSAADVQGGQLTGEATVGVDGKAYISVNLAADATTEGVETLTVTAAGKTASVSVADTSAAPAAPTSSTVTAAQIVTSNALAGNNAVTIDAPDAGAYAVTLNTDVVTSDGGFVISGNANLTVTSGAQADTISVVGDGNNSISTGAGSDTVTVVGTGTNAINVGAGSDVVTGGTGNDTITFGAGQLGAGDVVTGGDGTDTVVISGDGNIIGGAGAALTGVENLVMNGTTVTITKAALEALDSVSGHATTSEVTVDVASGNTLDLSGTTLTGLKSITADDNVTIVLSAAQIQEVGSITTAAGKNLTISTDVAGLLALGSKAAAGTGGTLAKTVSDTLENIQANSAAISAAGVTASLNGAVTVAQAKAALAVAPTVTFALSDTAANLALAPVAVFNNSSTIAATTAATAAQATAINAILTAATGFAYAANKVTVNVTDTASNIANYYVEATAGDDFDAVTSSGSSTAAEAIAAYALNATAAYSVVDTAANLVTNKAQAALDHASSITASDAATVDQISQVNAASDVDVSSGYALTDTLNHLTAGGAATIVAGAGNVIVSDATLSVANAMIAETLTNTGTTRYVVEDAIGTLLAANSDVVASTTTVSTSTATISASQANALVAKFGATKVADANLAIADTAANLLTLTAGAVAEANTISVSSGTATVDQYESLIALTGAKMPDVTVADSYANLAARAAQYGNIANSGAGSTMPHAVAINVTGTPTVAQVLELNLARWGTTLKVTGSYALSDSAANLLAAAVHASGADTSNEVLADAASVAVSDATSIANLATINGVASLAAGTTLTYSISDEAATIITNTGSFRAGATSLSITDASVTGTQATALKSYANFDGIYAIDDSYANILGTPTATNAILNAATSVTITDSVSNLEASSSAALTAIAAATTDDRLVINDTLGNLYAAAAATKAAATAFVVSAAISDVSDTADITKVNALRALKPVTYSVSDAYADINTALAATGSDGANETGAVTSFVANATGITLTSAVSVANFNTLDALTSATITSGITDTIANLSAANGATAVANALAHSSTITISNVGTATATVAQAETLVARGVTVTGLDIADTAAHIQAMNAATWTATIAAVAGNTIVVSDNGALTLSVAQATQVYSADGSQYANYSISDTAAHIVSSLSTAVGLVNYATAVTATDNATVSEANTLADATTFGTAISYSVTVAAADVLTAAGVSDALNAAVNITASDAQTVADARILNEATNSGTTSYAISDAASAFVNGTPATQALISAAVEAATGTVTATGNASLAQAAVIGGLTKSVTYSISDTAANVANATTAGINEAVNIAITTALSASQAATFLSATNSGTTTLTAVTDTAANALGLTLGANDVITTLTVTGDVSAVDAAAIAAKDTGANIGGAVVFAGTISGSSTEIAAIPDAVLDAATTVNVTGAMTVAQYNALAAAITIGNVDSYALRDSFSNLMVNSDVAGAVDANAAIAGATTVTVTDTALTIAQADAIDGLNVGDVVYDIRDTDAKIVAALNGNGTTETALLAAANVYSADGVLLDIQTVGVAGTLNVISGTKAEIDALSTVLKATEVAYEVSVADLEANPNFYSTLAANQHLTVIDTVANLTAGNALLAAAEHIVVSDAATVDQATAIRALSSLDDEVVYSLTDTAAALSTAAGASSVVDAAVNVTATTAATFAQAANIAGEANSGTTTYSITDTDALTGMNAAGINGATNITVTGTTGISAANAATLLAATNTGTTTIAKVTGASADLAALSVGSNDVITTVTPSDAATVAQAVAMLARAGSISAYSLSDTAENLAAASSSILNGATNIALSSGVATVAEATVIEAATNSGTTTYAIEDRAANVLAASVAVLEGDSNDTVVITDATVTAGIATSLRAFDAANNDVVATGAVTEGFAIAQAGAAGVFVISDSQANIVAAANADAVAASTDVRVTGTLTVAQGVAVKAAATADGAPTYSLTDTYTNLVINHSGVNALTLTSVDVTVSNNVNVAQANIIDGYGAHSVTQNIVDTASNVATAAAANDTTVNAANSVTLSGAATVAQAATIEQKVAHLSGGYAITDSAAAVFSALNTANGAAGTADRGLLNGATSITLNSAATVAQALGGAANSGSDAEARGLYTISGLSYAVTDTVDNIIAGLEQTNDATGITGATALNASDTSAMSVEEAATLTSLSNFQGYDHDSSALTAGRYYITDDFANIQAADTALISGATTVVANGTTGADIIDLSMHANGITINGDTGADTIIGTAGNDVITGGVGADNLTGGAGADTFVFATGATGITLATADTITDFATAADFISTSKAAGAGTIANGGALAAAADQGLAAFIVAADAVLTAGAGNDDVYIAYNVAGLGNAYLVVDENDNGSVDAGDTLVVLTGVDLVTEIALANLL